jgi:hypothetical protein
MLMKQVSKSAIAVATFACASIFSFGWSEQGSPSLAVDAAQARVGRPLTPVSYAGVARRQTRRAVYGYGVAGAAAVGTAAVVAATAPGYREWGNTTPAGNNWMGAYAAQNDPYFGQPYYVHRAYHGQSPYYGYSGWSDYSTRNSIRCTPGGVITLDDGHTYTCQ